MTELLHTRVFGERGPLVALLHGWGWDGRLMAPLAEALGGRARVVQPDLPGYGLNADRDCTDFEDCVDQLMATVPDADVVVGWSLGGLLALRWASLVPLRKLALIGATPRFMQAFDWPHGMSAERFDAFADAFDDAPMKARTRFAALSALGDADARQVRATMAGLVEQPPLPSRQALDRGLHWLHHVDLREAVHGVSARVLCLHGAEDRVVDAAACDWMSSAAGAHCVRVPGAAHLPWLQGGVADLCEWVGADD
ncbi:alpha/beta fold hydrolase [Methyloversatilis sp.]|uniref:alpha/beta fold hydrolase n=1 Tax=Methyloversatilis sp. TaxID=2569862 RepID=UPI002735CA04|nr:alpha/beta fold hydrolase [Methyloversatilis sp.]MDP2870175.1 alpha/beta fold hydrolase [Methyloversatilis sp.]MDP3456046.1 alpha/beta fold hydrolase [Methyloversatilis sp.]MDP3580243.1 alpha/beta fold hydrolase [Methyloversatilis sp.]